MKNRKKISDFIEETLGIKLLPYQKLILKMRPNPWIYGGRRPTKKLDNYILLMNTLLRMEEKDTISIVSPHSAKVMERDELLEWLENDYWR